jgi:hypothetical protein
MQILAFRYGFVRGDKWMERAAGRKNAEGCPQGRDAIECECAWEIRDREAHNSADQKGESGEEQAKEAGE